MDNNDEEDEGGGRGGGNEWRREKLSESKDLVWSGLERFNTCVDVSGGSGFMWSFIYGKRFTASRFSTCSRSHRCTGFVQIADHTLCGCVTCV